MVGQMPLPIQTMYAELVERAHIGQMAEDFDPAGTFICKAIRGRSYWYFRSAMVDGVRRDRYVGPDSQSLVERITTHRSEKDGYKQRRVLLSALIRSGMRGPDARTGRVLEVLASGGVFRMRAVVIGTAAYQTYSGLLGTKLASANAMTDDLDLAQFRTVSIAVEDRLDLPFLQILQRADPGFRALPDAFSSGRASRFGVGDQYRVEILVPEQGADAGSLVALPALRTDAQPLRFLDFLIYQEVQAVVLHGAGVPVNVPAPERYALHKLLVSRLRIATKESQTKAAKDLRQAGELIDVLLDQRPYEIKDLWNELNARGPKWRRLASEAVGLLDRATGSATVRERLESVVGPVTAP